MGDKPNEGFEVVGTEVREREVERLREKRPRPSFPPPRDKRRRA